MKALSKIAAGVSPSATLAVSALAKKMKAEGKDVIGFGAVSPILPRQTASVMPACVRSATERHAIPRRPV